jgi:hypothetical protein
VVKELLNRNANIEEKDEVGNTPLTMGEFFNLLFILSIC